MENIASKERRSSSRQACSSCSSNWVYPKECNFCHKYKIQHKGRSIFPTQVSTINAEKAIKSAAEKSDSILFFEIQHTDLIAKELKYRTTPSYKQFTKCVGPNSSADSENTRKGSSSYDKGNLQQQVLDHNQAVSMNILHALYGLQPSDTRYRHVLKNWLQDNFPDQLFFLSAKPNMAEIVINAEEVDANKNSLKTESNILYFADYL